MHWCHSVHLPVCADLNLAKKLLFVVPGPGSFSAFLVESVRCHGPVTAT